MFTFTKMKKFLVAILAFLYLSTSVGATVHMHYCMGKLADWGMGHQESKSCEKCGMSQSAKKTHDCCKDENKFIKNDTDQKTAEAVFQMPHAIAVALPITFFEMPATDISSVAITNPVSYAPPQGSGVAVYIRNCVFLI